MGKGHQNPKQKSINPFEVLAFVGLLGFLVLSARQLVFSQGELRPLGQVRDRILNQAQTPSAQRGIASIAGLQELPCTGSGTTTLEVKSTRFRLGGPLCGSQGALDAPMSPQVRNTSNESKGAVFVDLAAGRFLTDYLVLAPGENRIEVEFPYREGRVFKKTLTVKMTAEN